MIMGYENVMFSWGVDWQGENNEVLGIVNSEKAVEALEFYKGLYQFAPPGTDNAVFTETNSAFHQRPGDAGHELLRLPAGPAQRREEPTRA